VLFAAAAFSVFVTLAIVYVLVKESWSFFEHVPLTDFLFDTQWTPLFDDAHYGIMVLLSGTLTSSAVALVVAIPLGTIIALYLSEFAGFKVREIAKPFLELLGGVPTIVYGYFALTFLTPILQKIYPDLPGFNLLSAGLVMGIMIIPYVASLSEDAMRAVPMSAARGFLRDGRNAAADGALGGDAGGDFGHRLGLHPRHFARRGRDHDPRRRRRHAAQPDLQPDRAGSDHHLLHRAGGAGRPAARLDRLPDHLCRRPDPAADDPVLQPARLLAAQALPRGLLT
jgi:predicted membrane channel-forming protein YqfA (hemolysin III family)